MKENWKKRIIEILIGALISSLIGVWICFFCCCYAGKKNRESDKIYVGDAKYEEDEEP